MDQVGGRPRGAEKPTWADKALRDFDRVQEALADQDVPGTRKVLMRLRRQAPQMTADQRSQEALIKLAQQNITNYTRAAASSAQAAQRQQLLTAKCVGCGKLGSRTSLTKKSGSPRCSACHDKWAHPKCTTCGKPFKRDVSMPRQRVCSACGGGIAPTPRTVSGGLPTLGRGR
jgi:DNA-directed RNA polymerase subunit RPC12/RpoP